MAKVKSFNNMTPEPKLSAINNPKHSSNNFIRYHGFTQFVSGFEDEMHPSSLLHLFAAVGRASVCFENGNSC